MVGRTAGSTGIFGGVFSKRAWLDLSSSERSSRALSSRAKGDPGDRGNSNPRRTERTLAAVASPYSRDDRQALLILLAPFFFIAFSLASQQILRAPSLPHFPALARPAQPTASPAPVVSAPVMTGLSPAIVPRVPPSLSVPMIPEAPPEAAPELTIVPAPGPATTPAMVQQAANVRTAPLPLLPRFAMPEVPPLVVPPPALAPPASLAPPTAVAPVAAEPKMASLDTALRPDVSRPIPRAAPLPTTPAPTTCAAPAALFAGVTAARSQSPLQPGEQRSLQPSLQPAEFGRALALAAQQQLGEFVIYNARYSRIAYPMGDVAGLYGAI